MPLIRSTFAPPFLLRNGHVQTVLGALVPRGAVVDYESERLELPDGDFIDLDWAQAGRVRLAIVSHGLEGNSSNSDIRALATALNAHGWDVLAWNYRGCSGEENRLPRFYHSGDTPDLAAVIDHASKRYGELALIGFSLGGNLTLKYLGEGAVHPAVRGGVAVSAPIDLASSARVLDEHPANRLYLVRFMRAVAAKIEAKAARFPGAVDARGVRQIRSFARFDDRYTARLHGFRDADDYWERSSARPLLGNIGVPALLLNARDDPFLAPESFPDAVAGSHPHLFLETPASGGHLGFLDGRGRWISRRVPEFLSRFIP